MRSVKTIRAAKAGTIALSAMVCALGLLLMLRPGVSIHVTGALIGAVMIAFGVIKLVGFFSHDLYRLAFQFDLAFGLLLIALGTVILVRPLAAMNLLCLLLAAEIAADGLFKVQMALDARRFGLQTWWLIMALAVLTGAAGIAMALEPWESARALTALVGAALMAEGALNLAVGLCAVKIIPHQQPDALEMRFVIGGGR